MTRRPIPLAAGSARCPSTRQVPCADADRCARGTAPHAIGRQVNDYSTETRAPNGSCGWFIAIAYAEPEPAAPTVHDAPEGLC